MSTSTTVITSLFCKKEIQFGEALTRQIPKRLQKKIRKGIKRGGKNFSRSATIQVIYVEGYGK